MRSSTALVQEAICTMRSATARHSCHTHTDTQHRLTELRLTLTPNRSSWKHFPHPISCFWLDIKKSKPNTKSSKATKTNWFKLTQKDQHIDTIPISTITAMLQQDHPHNHNHRRRLHRGNRELRPSTHARTGANVAFCPGTFHGCALIF